MNSFKINYNTIKDKLDEGGYPLIEHFTACLSFNTTWGIARKSEWRLVNIAKILIWYGILRNTFYLVNQLCLFLCLCAVLY